MRWNTLNVASAFKHVCTVNMMNINEKFVITMMIIAVQSFINIPLLGMACMWHDRGNELQVSGPFLPPALVDGRWLDEVKSGRYTR
ncbi:immunity 49 family protein [Vibrio navarrensis]|nr:immunity 49 family protein [Vibrio navarrensis]QOD67476.1 immunity 49 family protein [Vibrio navarrensis]